MTSELQAAEAEAVPIKPAATIIPLRDSDAGVEVLVLRRDTNLAFHGGSWVFPGGRLDPEDFDAAGSDDENVAARYAAVREAKEEADLDISPDDDLVQISHWTTPLGRNRRFSTWFFVVRSPEGEAGEVTVDDGEIREFEWHTIEAAISGCRAGEIMLAAPTYISLLRLSQYATVADAMAGVGSMDPEVFLPRLAKTADGVTYSVYQGDPAHVSGDLTAPGPQHRTEMLEKGFRYVNELYETITNV